MNLLFICSRNQIRSVTAERIYSNHPTLKVRSAGTASSARRRVTEKDIQWADLIFAFEDRHRQQMKQRFRDALEEDRVIVLDLPDIYTLMEEELIQEIQTQVELYITS